MIAIEWHPTRKQLRTFGLFGGAVLMLLGVWAWVKLSLFGVSLSESPAQISAGVLWGIAVALVVMATVYSPLLRPLYLVLSVVTWPIGFVLSHVLLFMVYFFVLTPLGLVLRLTGRDVLARTFEPDAESYWVPVDPPADPKRYFRQF